MSFKFNWNPELKFGASQVLQSSKTITITSMEFGASQVLQSSKTKFILIWEFKTILKPFLQ